VKNEIGTPPKKWGVFYSSGSQMHNIYLYENVFPFNFLPVISI
jgi:hypothetical protein